MITVNVFMPSVAATAIALKVNGEPVPQPVIQLAEEGSFHVQIFKRDANVFDMRFFVPSKRSGRESLAIVTSQIEALRQAGATFVLCDARGNRTLPIEESSKKFSSEIDNINRKVQRISSKYCPIMRFILRSLGNRDLPMPIQGTFSVAGHARTAFEADYAKTLVSRQEYIENNLPFLSYMIDSFLESGSSVLNHEDSCCSLEGRVKCFKNALTYAIAAFVMPVIAICALIGKGKNFYKEGCLWSIIDVPLGIAVSPLIMGATAVKFLVAGIFHPGLIYNRIPSGVAFV